MIKVHDIVSYYKEYNPIASIKPKGGRTNEIKAIVKNHVSIQYFYRT